MTTPVVGPRSGPGLAAHVRPPSARRYCWRMSGSGPGLAAHVAPPSPRWCQTGGAAPSYGVRSRYLQGPSVVHRPSAEQARSAEGAAQGPTRWHRLAAVPGCHRGFPRGERTRGTWTLIGRSGSDQVTTAAEVSDVVSTGVTRAAGDSTRTEVGRGSSAWVTRRVPNVNPMRRLGPLMVRPITRGTAVRGFGRGELPAPHDQEHRPGQPPGR